MAQNDNFGETNNFFQTNTYPTYRQGQVTVAAANNGGSTSSGSTTAATQGTTNGANTVTVDVPSQTFRLSGKPDPTSYFGKIWTGSQAAQNFMGDDNHMSGREQYLWRTSQGIDKHYAKLFRKSLNYGAKASRYQELANTSNSALKAKYQRKAAKFNALSNGYGQQYMDSYVYPAAVDQYNTQVGEELAKQAAYEKELPGLLKYAAHTAWDEGLEGKHTWDDNDAWDIAWGDDEKSQHLTGSSKGIQNLQKYLNKLNPQLNLATDGAWGPKTAQAVADHIEQIKDPQERQIFINSVRQALNLSGVNAFNNANTTFKDVSDADKQNWANNYLFKATNFDPNAYQERYNKYKTNPRTNWNITAWKNGGKMKINYFQEGGAVAQPTQQPAASAEDIQTQVVQLVQAAMQGDEKAAQTVQQIMQAADQGDEQAVQIAQMIQDIIQQMQGQAKAAKRGAKLSYIHSLKTGCPEGYSVSYYQKGGHICKECLKNKLTEEQKKSAEKEAPKSAEGSKLSKSNLKRKLCAGKKLAEGDKLTPREGKNTK